MKTSVAGLAAFFLLSAVAFAQGAAEAALSHSLSTSMGSAVGKALGNVTNKAAGQVAGTVRQQTSVSSRRPVAPVAAPARSQVQTVAQVDFGTTSEPPAGGSLIQSIEGAAPNSCVAIAQSSTDAPASAVPPDAKAPVAKTSASALKQNSCAPGAPYKAVVNLPAPK